MQALIKLGPANPMLLRVVTAGGRRFRHALIRWAYLGLLIGTLLTALLALAGNTGSTSLSDLAKVSTQVFQAISYAQLAMICLLAPIFTAGAITQERDSRTYNILLSTPLTNGQIVLGSLLSRLYFVTALLFSGLPVFAITLFYGGVTGRSIALAFAIAFTTGLFTGALAITIAVFRLGTGKTVFWFYVFNAVYLVGLFMLDTTWNGHQTTLLTGIHPFLSLKSVVNPNDYPVPDTVQLAKWSPWARWYLEHPATAYLALTSVSSVVLISASALVLRRMAQRMDIGLWQFLSHFVRPGKERKERRSRNVWANPVAWREAATRAGFAGRGLARWLTIFFGLLACVVLLIATHRFSMTVEEVREYLLVLVLVEFSVGLLVAANTSASAVTKERESHTLDLLLVTPITSRYYIWGKLRGLVSFMIPFAAVPTLTLLLVVLHDLFFNRLGTPWQIVWPETVLEMPLVLTVFLAWACMLGLQLSLKWTRTIVAVMASVGVLAGISAALGVCGFGALSGLSWFGLIVGSFSPFSVVCLLVDPYRFASSTFSLTSSSAMYGPGGAALPEWQGRLIVFVSLTIAVGVYCLVIWTMYKSMVKNFDMIIRKQHA